MSTRAPHTGGAEGGGDARRSPANDNHIVVSPNRHGRFALRDTTEILAAVAAGPDQNLCHVGAGNRSPGINTTHLAPLGSVSLGRQCVGLHTNPLTQVGQVDRASKPLGDLARNARGLADHQQMADSARTAGIKTEGSGIRPRCGSPDRFAHNRHGFHHVHLVRVGKAAVNGVELLSQEDLGTAAFGPASSGHGSRNGVFAEIADPPSSRHVLLEDRAAYRRLLHIPGRCLGTSHAGHGGRRRGVDDNLRNHRLNTGLVGNHHACDLARLVHEHARRSRVEIEGNAGFQQQVVERAFVLGGDELRQRVLLACKHRLGKIGLGPFVLVHPVAGLGGSLVAEEVLAGENQHL